MNGSFVKNKDLLENLISNLCKISCDIVICPPSVYLSQVSELVAGSNIKVGSQDVSKHHQGAFTGEVSVNMLVDLGVGYCIVGHSERRIHHNEMDDDIAIKVNNLLDFGMVPIVCVGETYVERESGCCFDVISKQLIKIMAQNNKNINRLIIAYEPVWAIGTGLTATAIQVQGMHEYIRNFLSKHTSHSTDMKILYGGSLHSKNCAEILSQLDVDGGLVGGASLIADEFVSISS